MTRGPAFRVMQQVNLTIRPRVRYVVHNPLLRVFREPREATLEAVASRRVTADEATGWRAEKWGWLGRDLQFQ